MGTSPSAIESEYLGMSAVRKSEYVGMSEVESEYVGMSAVRKSEYMGMSEEVDIFTMSSSPSWARHRQQSSQNTWNHNCTIEWSH